jgi:pyruvate ferredoxin oxidoreductase gamma subunit
MQTVDVLAGLKPDGKVLVNSQHPMELGSHKVYHTDLTGIALSLDLVLAGNPILNTPLLGAVAKAGIISRESAQKAISSVFADDRNNKAAVKAFEDMEA